MTPDRGLPPDPLDGILESTSAAQLKALSHPLRHRLLRELAGSGATVSQLSVRLATNKGNVAHHLRVLADAGLVQRDRTRTVRGGTEQYWTRLAKVLRFDGGPEAIATRALMEMVTADVAADPDPLLHVRHVRLTRAAARAVAEHLDRVVADLPDAAPGEATYGVLVSVYRLDARGRARSPM